jgi:hypothetical protein
MKTTPQQNAAYLLFIALMATYSISTYKLVYSCAFSWKVSLFPLVLYAIGALIYFVYCRFYLWWDIFDAWFNRKSEDERTQD